MIPLVAVERVVFLGEVRHEQAETSAVIVVAKRDAHAPLLGTVLADCHAKRKRLLLEGAVLLIDVHEVGSGIVRDIQVGPPVVVVIEPGDAQSEVSAGIAYARLLGDVGEVAVPVIVKEEIGFTRETARPALHRNAAIFTRLVLAEFGQSREVDLDVAADEEIELSIVIVVREAAAGRPSARADARTPGDVLERAVVAIVIEAVSPDTGDVHVLPAVAIHVGGADAHPPAGMCQPRLLGDVFEPAMTEIVVERAARGIRVAGSFDGQRVDEINIRQTVVVVVEQRDAAAHRFHDELLFGGGVMLERDPRVFRDIAKQKRRGSRGLCRARGSHTRRGEEQAGNPDAHGRSLCAEPLVPGGGSGRPWGSPAVEPAPANPASRSALTVASIARSFCW